MKKDRNEDSKSMKDSVQNFLEAMGIDQKMIEASVLSRWEEIMGGAVERRTEKKYIKNRILYVELNSSVMRDQLMQERTKIIEKINKAAGVDLIDSIYLA